MLTKGKPVSSVEINVLLISKKTDHALMLHKSLSRVPGYKVLFEETAEAAMDHLTHGTMDCVIFNFENLGLVQVKLIQGIKQVAKISQFLVFADHTEEDVVEVIKEDKTIVLLEKNLINLEKDIEGLCYRLIGVANEKLFKRESKRHPVRQKATVQFTDSGRVVMGVVRDISEKGACLELHTNFLNVGDKLKISIELDQLDRKRIVLGEIRWGKTVPGRALVGVKFFKNS